MNFLDRFKFFFLGLLGGIFLVILFFGNRNSCKGYVSNYLPEGRVKQEVLYYPIEFSPTSLQQLAQLQIDTALFRSKIIDNSSIDFDNSEPRKKPCSQYQMTFQDSLYHFDYQLDKCKEKSTIVQISPK